MSDKLGTVPTIAVRNNIGSDIFWSITIHRINFRWLGYNDNYWWTNVATSEAFLVQKKGPIEAKLFPHLDVVLLTFHDHTEVCKNNELLECTCYRLFEMMGISYEIYLSDSTTPVQVIKHTIEITIRDKSLCVEVEETVYGLDEPIQTSVFEVLDWDDELGIILDTTKDKFTELCIAQVRRSFS